MRVIVVTGMSGSGKSVAIRLLEDIGYYCVDNLPPSFLTDLCTYLAEAGHGEVAVSIDARSEPSLARMPAIVTALRNQGHDVRTLFLTASTDALVQRYSESRRRHPLSDRVTLASPSLEPTLEESIAAERELLAPMADIAHLIDSSSLAPAKLRQWVRQFAQHAPMRLTLTFESFAFKQGVPMAADLMFDVRNMPNPHYDPALRPLTGCDEPVANFLAQVPLVREFIDDVAGFLRRWLPSYQVDDRYYVTVAIGCTGGQHRSVYVAEELARRFRASHHVLARHRAVAAN
jgi:UPF0042 nucleotide-binding protein